MEKVQNIFTLENLQKDLSKLYSKYDSYQVLKDWFKLMAIAINNGSTIIHDDLWQEREKQYLETINKYSKEEQTVFVEAFAQLVAIMDNDIQNGIFKDWLGELYMLSGVQSKNKGQFFTPYSAGKLMADLTVKEQLKDNKEIITFNDCCVGAGCLPIAFCNALKENNVNYQQRAFISCQDNDERCFYMCYIQLSLIGAVARVEFKDTLMNKNLGMTWDTPLLKLQYHKFKGVIA